MGVDEDKFWNMDLAEIGRYVNAYKERQLIEKKAKASDMHNLGRLIGLGVGSVAISNKIKYPSLSETFPTLFNSEEEQQMQQQAAISRSVANFMNFANAHNKKWEKNNGREIKDINTG